MVLSRTPKQYKHFMRGILTSLAEHERIVTTNAKAKHVMRAGNKLIRMAKKAEAGMTSPLNLLKGRVTTEKAYKKLLLEIAPRLKDVNQNFVLISKILKRRKGDNAPLVAVSIKGNEKSEMIKNEAYEEKQKRPYQYADEAVRVLQEEKLYYEQLVSEHPELVEFMASKIGRVDFELWMYAKNPREPKKYIVL